MSIPHSAWPPKATGASPTHSPPLSSSAAADHAAAARTTAGLVQSLRVHPLIVAVVLLLTSVGWTVSSAHAQSTGTLVARVTDAGDGRPIEGANVTVGSGRGAATDGSGRVVFGDVPVGRRTVEVRFIGYRTARETIRIRAGDTTRVAVALTTDPTRMEGVEVTALPPSLQPSGSVDAERIREIGASDAGRFLRSVPGVETVRRGPLGFDPNVRGLSETEVGVYIGGMRTFPAGPLRMDSPLSHVDPSSVASIDVVKGPYALTWGPGNMSAVRVKPKGDNPPPVPLTGTVQGGYETNSQAADGSAFVMGRRGRVSYSASGAYRTGSDYAAGDDIEIPADYTTGEARGHLGIALSPALTLDVRGGYQEQLDIDYPGRLLNASYFRTGMGQVDLEYAPESRADRSDPVHLQRLDVQVHGQQTLHRMDNEGKPTFEAGMFPDGSRRPPLRIGVDAEIQNFGGRIAGTMAWNRWTAEVGGDVLWTYRNARRPFRAVRMDGTQFVPPFYASDRVWPGVRIAQQGAFINLQRALGSVQLSATGRLDLVQSDADSPSEVFLQNADAATAELQRSHTMASGAVTASIPLSSTWTVSAGIGSVARPPDALELYSDRIPASKAQTSAEFQGNPFLDPERSTQADLWLEGGTASWSLQASAFARRLDDYVTLEPTGISPLLPLSPSTVYQYVNGQATFFGGEVQGAVRVHEQVRLRASGSYLWGRDDTLDEPALGVAPLSAEIGGRWTIPISSRTVQQLYLDGHVQATAEQDRVAATRGEGSTSSYAVAGLQTGLRLDAGIEVRVSADNLFDADYTHHLSARNPFTGTPVPEPGRTLSLEVAYTF